MRDLSLGSITLLVTIGMPKGNSPFVLFASKRETPVRNQSGGSNGVILQVSCKVCYSWFRGSLPARLIVLVIPYVRMRVPPACTRHGRPFDR